MNQAKYTPEQMILRRREQRKRWREDNWCWWRFDLSKARKLRRKMDEVWREKQRAMSNAYNHRMVAAVAVLLLCVNCFAQDLNPAHTKFIESTNVSPGPTLVIPQPTIAIATTNFCLQWTRSGDESASDGYSVMCSDEQEHSVEIRLGFETNTCIHNLPVGHNYVFTVVTRAKTNDTHWVDSDNSDPLNMRLFLRLDLTFPYPGTHIQSCRDFLHAAWYNIPSAFNNGVYTVNGDGPQEFYRLMP